MEGHFVIHHLSDLHIGPLRYSPERRVQVAPEAPHNLTFYREYLERLQQSSVELLPDIIVISRDLTSYAKDKEMDTAQDEIEKIIATLKTRDTKWRHAKNAPYVFIVPGNHDLDWREETYENKINEYVRLANNLAKDGSILSGLYHDKRREVHYDFGDDCNVFIYLLSSISLGGTLDPRIEEIHKKLAELHRNVISASGDKIGPLLEELHRLGRQDPGYIDEADLRKMNAVTEGIQEHRFKIAVMHHNPTSVPSGDLDAYDAIINAGSVKMKLIESKFDLVLHGHRHFLHSNHERLPHRNLMSAQGFFVIGADSLGCKPDAPFLKIELKDTECAHGPTPPACIISASEYKYNGINITGQPIILKVSF